MCLLCEDKNVIQKAALTTPRQRKLKLSVISLIVSLPNRTAKRLTEKRDGAITCVFCREFT